MKTRSPSEIARLTDAEAEKFNAAGPRRCAEIGCGYACAPADTYCRKHGGNEAACGICGDVTCPGHDGRTGARLSYRSVDPVALADHGDNCATCHRPLNVNEPVYRAKSGGVRCAGCEEKSAVPARDVRGEKCWRCGAEPGAECDSAKHDARADVRRGADGTAVAIGQCSTSLLMHTAAQMICAAALSVLTGATAADASAIARELRKRALLLERTAAEASTELARDRFVREVLRAIGEVRS